MADEEDYSSKPSGVLYRQSKKGAVPTPPKSSESKFSIPEMPNIKPPEVFKREQESYGTGHKSSGSGSKADMLAAAAFVLALVSLAISILGAGGIGGGNVKAELAGISADLKAMQVKDMVLSAPIRTTVSIDEEIPLNEVFPPTFRIPITFNLKLPEKVTAVSTTGQVSEFKFGQTVPISQDVFIDTKSSAGVGVKIQKEIPIDTNVQASIKVKDVYGSELEDIIERLDRIAG